MIDFSSRQAKQLVKHLSRRPVALPSGSAECFLLRYVFLESCVRLVGRYYRDRSTTQKKTLEQDSSLNVEVVKRSLKHFGIPVNERRVDSVLASPKVRRGFKTARVLRNGLVHRWDAGDAEEAIKRFDELEKAMEDLIDSIDIRVRGVPRQKQHKSDV